MKQPKGNEHVLFLLHGLAAPVVLSEFDEKREGNGVQLHVEVPRVGEEGGVIVGGACHPGEGGGEGVLVVWGISGGARAR